MTFLNRHTPPKIVTLTLLAGLSALTMNIFLPSLPGMAKWFDAPYALMQLSVALYLALSAVLQVLIGPISDRYGRRNVILAALILFLLATLGTLLAPDVTTFLICRMALSRAVMRDMMSEDEAASMIGHVTMGDGIGLPSANAGILSVRPDLAGTASGLGGAIMIGGGAGLAALAGALLTPGSTELPLNLLMLASSIASVLAILAVMRRARRLGL